MLAGAHLRDPDSPEMCRRLLAGMPELNVLFIGVNANPELVASVIRAGAAGVVPHTIDEDELVEAIRTAAAGRMVMSKDTLTDVLRAERAATASDPLANLTSLERELFALVGEGLTNAEIAERMRLSPERSATTCPGCFASSRSNGGLRWSRWLPAATLSRRLRRGSGAP